MKILTIALVLSSLASQVFLELSENGRLNFTGIANKYGYNCEEHTVVSEDGYILKLFHVPGNSRKPILLMHGNIDSADTFIVRGNRSLVAVLSNQGYDIWVGNIRGTHYCREHTRLDPDRDKQFWDYSFHEMGYYDLPAIIDFVLSETKANKLSAVGHSLGNTIFYVLGSTKPEYNEKVNILVVLAPICYLSNLPPPWGLITQASNVINSLLIALDTEEVFDKQLRRVIQNVCEARADMCVSFLEEMVGADWEEVKPKFVRTLIGHFPTSTSRKNLMHLARNAVEKKFCQYDYGSKVNLEKYGQTITPDYDLKKVTMKVALYAGKNDKMAPIKNVELLLKNLPNVVDYQVLRRRLFNHIDHVWGKNMDKYLFPHVMKILKKFN